MRGFALLNQRRQFEDPERLKKGDSIIVQWRPEFAMGNKDTHRIELYRIVDIKRDDHEVICRKKGNIYFNYNTYLEGKSNAEQVYLIIV